MATSSSLQRYQDGHGIRADPLRPARVGLLVVVAFVGALALWGNYAQVSEAAQASGNLRVAGNRQSVQQPDGGVVRELHVKDGQHVTQGQILLTLSDTSARSQVDVLRARSDALELRERRLVGERDGRADIELSGDLARRQGERRVGEILASERAVMTARHHQHDVEIRIQRDKITQLEAQIRGALAQLTGYETQTKLLQDEEAGARKLLATGSGTRNRVLALDRDLAGLIASREGKNADIAQFRKAIDEARLELVRIESTRVTEIADQLRSTETDIADVQPKLMAARDVLDRTQVRAPATGIAVGLSVFTEGGVVSPGAKILDIVPDDSPLIVDARLPIREVDQVAAGHEARIDLSSVDRNHRPRLHGKVLTVSADRVSDPKSDLDYYKIEVAIDPQDAKKSKLVLQSGMKADVIVTGRHRTFVEYLVGPLLDEIRGAFRER